MGSLMLLILGTTSCGSDDDEISNNPKEVSITGSADVQSYHSVVLKGYANGANGKVGFCYSATDNNPNPESCSYVETSTLVLDQSYELTIDGLLPNTKYYYRAYATKDLMIVLAKEVKTFTTEEFKAEAVDLGLPSGLKWATCNVGASSPEEYGDYFAWGETEPKTNYIWSTYRWCNCTYTTITKYCVSSIYGTVDSKTTLDPEDDVAHVKWGGAWRMPTDAEQDELRKICSWSWTTQNGVKGYTVTGLNGNSIFLPAAGYRYDDNLDRAGGAGYYWSSSLFMRESIGAYSLQMEESFLGWSNSSRSSGRPVRPICQ